MRCKKDQQDFWRDRDWGTLNWWHSFSIPFKWMNLATLPICKGISIFATGERAPLDCSFSFCRIWSWWLCCHPGLVTLFVHFSFSLAGFMCLCDRPDCQQVGGVCKPLLLPQWGANGGLSSSLQCPAVPVRDYHSLSGDDYQCYLFFFIIIQWLWWKVTQHTMTLVLGVHNRAGNTDTNRQSHFTYSVNFARLLLRISRLILCLITRKVVAIDEIVIHPSYDPSGYQYDIALLKVSFFNFSRHIGTIT